MRRPGMPTCCDSAMRNRRFGGAWLLLAVAASGGCTGTACDKRVLYAAPAPDGAVIAFLYRRDCGPRGIGTHVSVVPFDASLRDEPGNVLSLQGEQTVKLTWLDAKRLSVANFHDPTYQLAAPIQAVAVEFHPAAPAGAR
jgi:hypothetical protein